MRIGDSESEVSWSELFSWLKARGLHGVDFVTSDYHGGLVKAVATHFQGSHLAALPDPLYPEYPGRLSEAS